MNIVKDTLHKATEAESTQIESKDTFWSTFRTRAARLPQASVPSPTFYRRHETGIRWTTATASLAVITALLFLNMRPATAYADTVQSLQVAVSHAAVMIFNDDAEGATIVWIEEQ
ncbi:MAG: hypothetical protein OSB41_10985 [Kiritimatiellae bacterium]|nr:hypothetical protein [Kiritimatiellia bacterium]